MTYEESLKSKDIVVPVVDFSSFTSGIPLDRQKCAEKILEAFTTVGFVYLSNALPLETIDKAFTLSKEFFAKPAEEKLKVEWESFIGKRGFVVKGSPSQKFSNGRTRADFQSR
jgi:isopenicillin N synthase-like dioxygenase